MKPDFKHYWHPTPIFFRKVGDFVLLVGTTFTATFAGIDMPKEYVIGAALATAIGKIFTNMFKE